MTNHRTERPDSPVYSRRDFLKTAAAATAAGLLSHCAPSAKLSRTATLRRPEILSTSLAGKSRVVRTRHNGVWKQTPAGVPGDNALLDTGVIRKMLDSSITALTGLADARDAWSSLFARDEWIAIKINTIQGSRLWTHEPLAAAVAESLVATGIPSRQIILYDRNDGQMRAGGFTINRGGDRIQCFGTESGYTSGWRIADRDIKLSNCLLQCDALINIPIYKAHGISGFTFSLKNHYGTLERPEDFHRPLIGRAIPELNSLPAIKDRTRLIVGDVLTACTVPRSDDPYWRLDTVGDSILMSFDPVAHDTVGLGMIYDLAGKGTREVSANGVSTAQQYLRYAEELGVGSNRAERIEMLELDLG
ncbi:MAG: DUF362 domain-containing protein [Anaerolineales bacterium]